MTNTFLILENYQQDNEPIMALGIKVGTSNTKYNILKAFRFKIRVLIPNKNSEEMKNNYLEPSTILKPKRKNK